MVISKLQNGNNHFRAIEKFSTTFLGFEIEPIIFSNVVIVHGTSW